MSEETKEDGLVKQLLKYEEEDNRGALAALRSGVGKRPGEAVRMYPYIVPYLPSSSAEAVTTRAAFLVASLFGLGREIRNCEGVSLGLATWYSVNSERNPTGKHGISGAEARFVAALDADPDDLPRHLTGLILLCDSGGGGVKLDWAKFHKEVRYLLGDLERYAESVRYRWARDFYQGPTPSPAQETQP